MRATSVKFNIPDVAIIVKWKKDFANFGIEALYSKPKESPTQNHLQRGIYRTVEKVCN